MDEGGGGGGSEGSRTHHSSLTDLANLAEKRNVPENRTIPLLCVRGNSELFQAAGQQPKAVKLGAYPERGGPKLE